MICWCFGNSYIIPFKSRLACNERVRLANEAERRPLETSVVPFPIIPVMRAELLTAGAQGIVVLCGLNALLELPQALLAILDALQDHVLALLELLAVAGVALRSHAGAASPARACATRALLPSVGEGGKRGHQAHCDCEFLHVESFSLRKSMSFYGRGGLCLRVKPAGGKTDRGRSHRRLRLRLL